MVNVSFVLKSIVEVNEASQKFTCNGLFQFKWTDEILAWIIKTSNIKNEIQPLPENIWRPRVMIVNTLEDRELFHEHLGSMTIFNIGTVRWVPVSLFPTTCQLDLTYYPFDQQTCYLQLVSIPHNAEELQFTVRFPRAKILDYMIHGEWDLKKTEVQTKLVYVGTTTRSLIEVTIVMKRRPTCFIFNILLPVVLLSFLNIFVFVIPAESGEKISYGLTMLLALSVYLSTVSGMIPRSSLTLPNVIIYLFLLLFLSLITVISSIIVVLLHNKKEKEGKQQGVTETSSAPWGKVNYVRLAITSGPNTGNGVPIQYPEMKAALNKEHKFPQTDVSFFPQMHLFPHKDAYVPYYRCPRSLP
nr:acetylcholine receptor subunit beta-like 1 [Biomphalaria glabrata]